MPTSSIFNRLMAVLTRYKQHPYRHTLCYTFSSGRTESSKELTDQEAMNIINHLEGQTIKMRRKLISLCYDLLWVVDVKGEVKADINRLNQWCIKYGKYKKDLNSHIAAELQVLITQFEKMNAKVLSS